MYAYIAVTHRSVSPVLVKTDAGVQRLVYYVSKSPQEADIRYLSFKKAILVIVHAIRKLPHYFQAHIVIILTQLPLQAFLQRSNHTGRIVKCGTILEAFNIKYLPRTAIKRQVLANLVAEFTKCTEETWIEDSKVSRVWVLAVSIPYPPSWKIYTDRATN